MPELLEQYEWYSSYNIFQYYCFQSAEIKKKQAGAALGITITSVSVVSGRIIVDLIKIGAHGGLG